MDKRGSNLITEIQKVTLTARDDANDDPMDDTSTGRPDAKSADDDVTNDRMQVDQPPARVRRVYVAPKYCEPFTCTCSFCQVEYVSGQVTCTTCGYEPLPVDESGDTKGSDQPNRRTRILEKRVQKLAVWDVRQGEQHPVGDIDQRTG